MPKVAKLFHKLAYQLGEMNKVALVKCNECRKKVSTKAASCPSCGAPVQGAHSARNSNWRYWVIGMGVLMILGLVLPADDEKEKNAPQNSVANSAQQVSTAPHDAQSLKPAILDSQNLAKAENRTWLRSEEGIVAITKHLMSKQTLLDEQVDKFDDGPTTFSSKFLSELHITAPRAKAFGAKATAECLRMTDDEVDRRIGFRYPKRPFELWVFTRVGLCKRLLDAERWLPGNPLIPTDPPPNIFENAMVFSIPTDTPGNRYRMSVHRNDNKAILYTERVSPRAQHPLFTRKVADCSSMQIQMLKESRDWEGEHWFEFHERPANPGPFKTPAEQSISWFQLQYACGRLNP